MASPDAPRSETEVVALSAAPITTGDLQTALVAAGVANGAVVIVHSSLSRLGWVVGGAQSVTAALAEAVGTTGTVVMPAQTGVSDPSSWMNPPVPEPWWPVIRDNWPAFDPQVTPLQGMGAVVECFRRFPDVGHSGHPANGFIARGPLAKAILASHPLSDSLGEPSPLGRLYEADARVVLIGVGHSNNTSLHLAESRAEFPGKTMEVQGAPLTVNGTREWITYEDEDYDEDDFDELGAAFAASGGSEQRATIGNGEIVTCSMREIVDFGTKWISKTRSESGETAS